MRERRENKKMTKILKKIRAGIAIVGGVYVIGSLIQGLINSTDAIQAERYLECRKEAVTRNIERYNQYIPIVREPFLSQYKDGLKTAVKDTTALGKEERVAEKEASRLERKILSSWVGFFID